MKTITKFSLETLYRTSQWFLKKKKKWTKNGRETSKNIQHFLAIEEMQIKILRFHFKVVRSTKEITVYTGKWDYLSLLLGVQACIFIMEINVTVPQEAGNHLLQDPAILGLAIYPRNYTLCYRGTCSSMFIVFLAIISQKWEIV